MGREALHSLVDRIDEGEVETVGRILMRYVAIADPLPDEVEAIRETEGEYEKGEYVSFKDVFA